MDDIVGTLQLKYLKAAITYEGIQRVETYPVPEPALREAILNAVLHRDYSVGAPIQISVYEDKLMVWNPAQLPEGWTVAKMMRKHASEPYNPDLANVFFRAGEIEAWGRGIERMCTACRDAGFPDPIITFDMSGLWVTFHFSDAYRNLIAGRPKEVTTEVTTEVRLLQAMTKELTRQAFRIALGMKNDEHFRKRYLLPALADGLIAMTLPDKPRSRLQKYRITEAGCARLSALGLMQGSAPAVPPPPANVRQP